MVSSGAPSSSASREEGSARTAGLRPGGEGRAAGGRRGSGLKVSRLARGVEDGYSSRLVPGLRSSTDADRLAQELAFAAGRLELLAVSPPGLYAEVAEPATDIEERTWLAFQIAYLGALDRDRPFAEIESRRSSWASGESPDLGSRRDGDPVPGARTFAAYRAWAARSGSQREAIAGEPFWTAERRFARCYERLALPGLNRDVRFELLVSLGRLGTYELDAGALMLGGADEATIAAKRILGIGDSMLLERRAAELAQACELPLAALDLGLKNFGTGVRATVGVWPVNEPDEATLERVRTALLL